MLWAAKNPWPPPFTSMSTGIQNILPLDCQDIPFMPRITLFPLNVESVECIGSRFGIRLCWFSSRCAGLLVYYFTSCRFPNLHGTMDIMQMTGDWHCLRIVKIEWSTNPAMIILALVQFAELQPIALKWTDQFCHDTHSLVASSRADMLLDSLLGRQDIGTWMLLDLGFTSVHFQGTIIVQQSTSSVVVFAVLNRTEVHKHYTCMRVLTVAVCKEWIQHWVLRIDSHSVFFCCALEQWKIPWTIILVSLRSWFQRYHAWSEFLYSFENFQWTIAWSLSYLFCPSVSWPFNYPPLSDWFLPCSTRRVFISSSEKLQWESAVYLDLALFEWKSWASGFYSWGPCLIILAGGLDVSLFLWPQFAIQSSLGSHDELPSSTMIGKLHDLEMTELKPWPYWELFPCILW